jgi:Cdc6-like AAA superfamily ATPase
MEFIHKDALEFLGSILDSIANELREIDKLNIPSKAEEIEDRNPFKFYRTDSVPKWDYQTIAQCFVPPIEFAKICETGTNTIIEGDRGSGKSTILRYLSLESQLGMKRNNKFISIYIKLKPGLVATTKRTEYDREIEKWVEFFSHYLNLIIIERTIETIKFCKMKGWIQIPSENETEFCKHINKFVIDEPNSETVFSLENCLENITYMRNKCQQIEERRTLKHTTSSAYVHTFMEQVVRLAPALDNKFIFICLDEIDNMDDDQKKVLVLFLRDRDAPINYKIGVKTGKMVYRDPYGSMLQFKDDYDIVYPDRFNKERTGEYIKFLEDLANRRLKEYNIDICSLLQLRKKEIRVDGKYYGFTDYCYLSSGIVRLFVTLLKDTIYYAYPQIVEKEIQFQPIPTKIQNEVIIIKSNIHFRNFQECEHPEEVRIFMNTLGALFKEILSKSILIDKPRTVSQIEIENYAQLDPAIRHLISETIDVSLLQIPLRARHQEKTKAPFFGFKFHRMLIPYFRLALPNRWPRTLDAPTMNQLIDIINGRMMQENWVAEITKKFNVDEPDKGTTLDEFDSEELIDRPITTLLDFNNQNVHGEKNE